MECKRCKFFSSGWDWNRCDLLEIEYFRTTNECIFVNEDGTINQKALDSLEHVPNTFSKDDINQLKKYLSEEQEKEILLSFIEDILNSITNVKIIPKTLRTTLDSWIETAYIASDNELLKDLADAEEEFANGGGIFWEAMERVANDAVEEYKHSKATDINQFITETEEKYSCLGCGKYWYADSNSNCMTFCEKFKKGDFNE